jgi:RNA 3'-terminal phosphate cyclase (ATP)
VDEHLADQLLDESQYRVAEVSTNLTTNGAIIAQFGLAQITLDEEEKIVVVKPGDR